MDFISMPTPTPAEVAEQLANVFADPAVADPLYDAILPTLGGKCLNADAARELCPHYNSVAGRLSFTCCTYDPCSAYVRDRLDRVLSAPAIDRQRQILFLAGGAASGKSNCVGTKYRSEFDLIFDSNLGNLAKARAMIATALQHGWLVDVLYINRNFRSALTDMIARAHITGRYIPLQRGRKSADLATLHLNLQQTFVKLSELYAENDDVALAAVNNAYPQPPGSPVTFAIPLVALASGGVYHYHDPDVLYDEQSELLGQLERDPAFDPEVLAALRGEAE